VRSTLCPLRNENSLDYDMIKSTTPKEKKARQKETNKEL
jgi:hypothetical protein